MEVIVKYVITDEDVQLFKKGLPKSPCIGCGKDRITCTGCIRYEKFNKDMQPFKDNGIIEFAEKFEEIRLKQIKIRDIKKEINDIYMSLPIEIRKIYDEDIKA